MAKGNALDHPIRAEIIDLLGQMEATPADMRRLLAVDAHDPSVLAYHLAVLESAELIERVGGVWRLRPTHAA